MEVARFWRTTSERLRMVGEVCGDCGNKIFPPRDVCPACKRETLVNLNDILRNNGMYTKQGKIGSEQSEKSDNGDRTGRQTMANVANQDLVEIIWYYANNFCTRMGK